MDAEKLSKLISETATETYNENIEYLVEQHSKEFETIAILNGKVNLEDTIRRTLTSYLRSSIELGTLNTIKVLKPLGVIIPDELKG